MKNEFTPGEWVVGEPDDGEPVCWLRDGVAVIPIEECPSRYSAKADARLIANAPELLNELEILVEEAEGKGIDCQCAKTVIGWAKGEQG